MRRLTRMAAWGLVLAATGPAWSWTLVYEGFPYEPPSVTTYTYDAAAYQIGNALYSDPLHPDPWRCFPATFTQGYVPFITGDNMAGLGLPAPTGRCIQLFSTSSTNGKGSRISPGGPRNGRFGFGPGTLYYSLMLKGITSSAAATPGNGILHAGFNNSPPGTDTLSLACARLLLRRSPTAGQFQVGLGDGSATNIAWHPVTFAAGAAATPVFIVGAYEFKNNWGASPNTTDDVHSMWINPDPASFGGGAPPPASLMLTGTDHGGFPALTVQSFFVRNAYAAANTPVEKFLIDEVRVGATWAGVTGDVACLPPTITDATPTVGQAGTAVTGVTITGTNFVRVATAVKLVKAGQPDIWATNVDVSSSTQLTCDFDLPATSTGLWDIVLITCPNAPQTLATKQFAISCEVGPPTVAGITPASAFAGSTITNARVAGSNFVTGATTVRLTRAGEPDIVGSEVSVIDANSLTCTFALPVDANAGWRDIEVTACGKGTLANGFNLRRCGEPRFDGDGDGDVDMADFAVFQRCLTTGAEGSFDASQCRCMRADEGTVIDSTDLTAFEACASGPSVPANPACDDNLPPL